MHSASQPCSGRYIEFFMISNKLELIAKRNYSTINFLGYQIRFHLVSLCLTSAPTYFHEGFISRVRERSLAATSPHLYQIVVEIVIYTIKRPCSILARIQ